MYKIYVSNIHTNVTELEVKRFFEKFGNSKLEFLQDSSNEFHKAIVSFEDQSEMKETMANVSQTKFYGTKIQLYNEIPQGFFLNSTKRRSQSLLTEKIKNFKVKNKATILPLFDWKINDVNKVKVVHVDENGFVGLQLITVESVKAEEDLLRILFSYDKLQLVKATLVQLNRGHSFLFLSSDNFFSRVEVMQVDESGENIKLLLVDEGKIVLITTIDSLYCFPDDEIRTIPKLTIIGIPICENIAFNEKTISNLRNLCSEDIYCKLNGIENDCGFKEMEFVYANGEPVDLNEARRDSATKNSICIELSSGDKVSLLHVVSCVEFYVCLATNRNLYNQMNNEFKKLSLQKIQFENAKFGDRFLCRDPTSKSEDNNLTRCELISNWPLIEVCLLDRGPIVKPQSIYQLPREFQNIPPLAYRCSYNYFPRLIEIGYNFARLYNRLPDALVVEIDKISKMNSQINYFVTLHDEIPRDLYDLIEDFMLCEETISTLDEFTIEKNDDDDDDNNKLKEENKKLEKRILIMERKVKCLEDYVYNLVVS